MGLTYDYDSNGNVRAIYDGDFAKEFITSRTPIIDAETGTMLYKVTYQINQSDYVAQNAGTKRTLALNSRDVATGGYYIDEGEDARMLSNGVLEFTRLFAIIPQSRDDYESFSMSYQLYVTGAGNILEARTTVLSRVHKDYFFALNPDTIPLRKAYRLFQFDQNTFYYTGEKPPDDATEILAEDEQINRWRGRGNIFVRKSRYVPVFNPSLLE